MFDEDLNRRPGFGGGVHKHPAGFAGAIKLRVRCPGEFTICPMIRVFAIYFFKPKFTQEVHPKELN